MIKWKVMGRPLDAAITARVARRTAPRIAAAVVLAIGGAGASGCKGQDGEGNASAAAETAPAPSAEPAKIEDEGLLARRDSLLATRLEIRTRRAELAEKREAIRVKGGDTSEIDRETDELSLREGALATEERSLLDRLLSERQAMVSAISSGRGGLPGREAAVATREKDLSRREQKLAERESQLATREEGLASKWKASCAATPTTIVQTVDARGTKYTRRDVEPLLARARSEMNKKGILRSDLPEPVQGLESEATSAMAKGDYGQARFAATQLLGTIRVIKVDKPFIADKIRRMNAALKGQRLAPAVEQLFREATQNVADGNFPGANRKLNRIQAAIQ
jgi:hypothetical protein